MRVYRPIIADSKDLRCRPSKNRFAAIVDSGIEKYAADARL